MQRREFLQTLIKTLRKKDGNWYEADTEGSGVEYTLEPGALKGVAYLSSDFLIDGPNIIVWALTLTESATGRSFRFSFGGLPQASFRMRFPLALTDQNRWMIEREGAFLKPLAGGDRVDPTRVDRMRLAILHKAPGTVRWSMTPLEYSAVEPPRLAQPALPQGKLIDRLGQFAIKDWPGKTKSESELVARLRAQQQAAGTIAWPNTFTRWGGWKARKLGEGTGFFGVRKDDSRWWLVDPDGYAFWSAGIDCVRIDTEAAFEGLETALEWMPEVSSTGRRRSVNFLAANLLRVFGPGDYRKQWARLALAELKRLRFNTVGNWSDLGPPSAARFPYVRPLSFRPRESGLVYRDFPDVFHAGFEADATAYAHELESTKDDPALLGYFLMNEPTWGFSKELPAAGMLYVTEQAATRAELARWLRTKYADDTALARAWQMGATFAQVERGRWTALLTPAALNDLRAFSVTMVDRYFLTISRACKKADPNHLNLGMRWAGVPPDWAVQGMKTFDVYSLNCYQDKLPRESTRKINALLNMPVMVGEYHFGALDVGLPASGIGHLKNQADRARAYRVYFDDAAANPHCVGAHWFTLYDQSALGRFDGENYNIGFLDICHRPYAELSSAAIASHERVYEVAAGHTPPFADAPEYLPKLFL